MTHILSFKNVSFSDNGNSIISDVTFDVERGEHIVLTGPSGSGKTTILLSLLGYNRPTDGTIHFKGMIAGGDNISDIRGEISYIPQEPVTGAATFRESLLLPFSFKRHREKHPEEKEILKLMKSLKLDESLLKKNSEQLSGGEKQRLAIARELLLGKKIFVLDEITSSLDPESKDAVMKLFSKREYTLLSISHDKDWIDMCSRNIVIKKGKISSDTKKERGKR